jgi:hypothetical protein
MWQATNDRRDPTGAVPDTSGTDGENGSHEEDAEGEEKVRA